MSKSKAMKHSKEFDAFDNLVGRALSVPHSIIKERIDEHRKQADKNPNKGDNIAGSSSQEGEAK